MRECLDQCRRQLRLPASTGTADDDQRPGHQLLLTLCQGVTPESAGLALRLAMSARQSCPVDDPGNVKRRFIAALGAASPPVSRVSPQLLSSYPCLCLSFLLYVVLGLCVRSPVFHSMRRRSLETLRLDAFLLLMLFCSFWGFPFPLIPQPVPHGCLPIPDRVAPSLPTVPGVVVPPCLPVGQSDLGA